MVSVCLPSDALLQHLPSYLGFSYKCPILTNYSLPLAEFFLHWNIKDWSSLEPLKHHLVVSVILDRSTDG